MAHTLNHSPNEPAGCRISIDLAGQAEIYTSVSPAALRKCSLFSATTRQILPQILTESWRGKKPAEISNHYNFAS